MKILRDDRVKEEQKVIDKRLLEMMQKSKGNMQNLQEDMQETNAKTQNLRGDMHKDMQTYRKLIKNCKKLPI